MKIGSTFDTKYLPGITGFLEKIPEDVVESFNDISLFRKTELCKSDRIMVGSSRFANHSCRPNCKYNIVDTGRRKIIKLEIIASINFGDEITVFYSSEDFFGEGNACCLCPHADLH